MLQDRAGKIAGQMWESLYDEGPQTMKELQKSTKLKLNDLWLGLGWLLREDKVHTELSAVEVLVALK